MARETPWEGLGGASGLCSAADLFHSKVDLSREEPAPDSDDCGSSGGEARALQWLLRRGGGTARFFILVEGRFPR